MDFAKKHLVNFLLFLFFIFIIFYFYLSFFSNPEKEPIKNNIVVPELIKEDNSSLKGIVLTQEKGYIPGGKMIANYIRDIKTFPDLSSCSNKNSLLFIDREGNKTSFINSDFAYCK